MSTVTQPLAVTVGEMTLDELRASPAIEAGHLFAILDACEEPRVPAKVLELGKRAVSLYRGRAERDLWAIAPYLVQVDHQLLEWIIENLWEGPWGIFAIAPVDLPALRRHFRQFLIVDDPTGRSLYFRFYDPRPLSTFLHSCDQQEIQQFYGPVDRLLLCIEPAKLRAYRPIHFAARRTQ